MEGVVTHTHQAINQGEVNGLWMTSSFLDDLSSLDMRAVEGQICFTRSAIFSVLGDP